MELLQLRYFLILAENKQLIKTAEALHISPPALSNSIKRLESELNTELFDRTNKRSMILTEKGITFYKYIKQSMDALDLGVQSVSVNGTSIRLGITNFQIWADAIYHFEECHPDAQIEYSLISVSDINAVEQDHFDLFLGAAQDVNSNLYETELLFREEKPLVIMSKQHPLSMRTDLHLKELRDETFITTKMVNSSAHQYMLSLCDLCGFRPLKILDADYLMRSKLLNQNRGIAIATEVGWNRATVSSENLTAVPLSYPILVRNQSVSWKKTHLLTNLEAAFIEHLKWYLNENPLF